MSRRKKTSLASNGSRSVQVRTLHGQFEFTMQRFCDCEKRFLQSDQLTSTGVKALCLHYATRLPFSEVSALTERLSGVRLLSEDSVWRLVQKEAGNLDEKQRQQIDESCHLPMPDFVALDDNSLYAATGERTDMD